MIRPPVHGRRHRQCRYCFQRNTGADNAGAAAANPRSQLVSSRSKASRCHGHADWAYLAQPHRIEEEKHACYSSCENPFRARKLRHAASASTGSIMWTWHGKTSSVACWRHFLKAMCFCQQRARCQGQPPYAQRGWTKRHSSRMI